MDDRQAIVDATIAYCWALDTKDWAALGDVFLPGATAELGHSCEGIDAIAERCRSALGHLRCSQHLVTNHQVSVDGDRATSRCYFHAQHVSTGGDLFVVAGRYEDEWERTSAGWRIRARVLVPMWTSGDPAAVRLG